MKPVRIVNKSRSTIIGSIPSGKNNRSVNVESSLERDFGFILEYDMNVEMYVEQPVTIEYRHDGVLRRYTPDFISDIRTQVISR